MTAKEEIQWASSVESEEEFQARLDAQWEAWYATLPLATDREDD